MAVRNHTSPKTNALSPLAQHRLRSGVTLEEIAQATKISLRFLRAIENENYQELPGGIFARSYIRQYAAAISFDEDELLRWYREQSGMKEAAETNLVRTPAGRSAGPKRCGLDWVRALSPIRFF